MAESIITKKALATSLKEVLEVRPFEKITIANICENCGMNRKSFYYHFKDKYDLVNWIFDTEFIEIARNGIDENIPIGSHIEERWGILQNVCHYLYANRSFYSKLFPLREQNCLADHFREICHPIFANRLKITEGWEEAPKLMVEFLTDAILCAIERWITANDPVPPEEFEETLIACIRLVRYIPEDFDAPKP